jgi:hypothetical protein
VQSIPDRLNREAAMDDRETLGWQYRFTFPDGQRLEFDVRLGAKTLDLVAEERQEWPEWTRLGYRQCSTCPLSEAEHPRCPIAANLAGVLPSFGRLMSFEEVDVEVATATRTYSRRVSVQQALGSLVGIYMVTSGCPVMDKLRPMVATHLPFASGPETTYRVLSMYLLAQYFRAEEGKEPDWTLQGLVKIHEDVAAVNEGFHRRISGIEASDAPVNAVAVLDARAQWTQLLLTDQQLDEIKTFFSAYLRGP